MNTQTIFFFSIYQRENSYTLNEAPQERKFEWNSSFYIKKKRSQTERRTRPGANLSRDRPCVECDPTRYEGTEGEDANINNKKINLPDVDAPIPANFKGWEEVLPREGPIHSDVSSLPHPPLEVEGARPHGVSEWSIELGKNENEKFNWLDY
ncbi:hypothetical protein CEXT_409371 [Caerostris extrusa]|uniref:Uncharacterized protein n=1 Tax=Caerostris extrusa TaxID=172846 RepID=A0AAV4RZC0_CAEEX|nr:hypothetical protein CEXT_409371 [Caerostris extrusa]